jgi:hypothetical protein
MTRSQKIPHVIMYRQVGMDYAIQAVCTCNWEGLVHKSFMTADKEGDEHLKRYERFPRLVTPD